MKRVVVTGLGIYSCIGLDTQTVIDSLRQGKSGIVLDSLRKELGYRSGLAGLVPRPELKGLLDRRSRIMLSEEAEFAYVATLQAIHAAGLPSDQIKQSGIIFGNDSTVKATYDAIQQVKETRYTVAWFRVNIPKYELHRNYESVYNFWSHRSKLYLECCLCFRLTFCWHLISPDQIRSAREGHLWWRSGSKRICFCKF